MPPASGLGRQQFDDLVRPSRQLVGGPQEDELPLPRRRRLPAHARLGRGVDGAAGVLGVAGRDGGQHLTGPRVVVGVLGAGDRDAPLPPM
jgi:hypothetical protein